MEKEEDEKTQKEEKTEPQVIAIVIFIAKYTLLQHL